MAAKSTLLDQAKSHVRNDWRRYDSPEHLDLALAYLRGEVSAKQISMALFNDKKNTNYFAFVTIAIRNAIQRGDIEITKRGKK